MHNMGTHSVHQSDRLVDLLDALRLLTPARLEVNTVNVFVYDKIHEPKFGS